MPNRNSPYTAVSKCILCDAKIPKRVSHLWEEELKGWLCKICWHDKYDAKPKSKSTLT